MYAGRYSDHSLPATAAIVLGRKLTNIKFTSDEESRKFRNCIVQWDSTPHSACNVHAVVYCTVYIATEILTSCQNLPQCDGGWVDLINTILLIKLKC